MVGVGYGAVRSALIVRPGAAVARLQVQRERAAGGVQAQAQQRQCQLAQAAARHLHAEPAAALLGATAGSCWGYIPYSNPNCTGQTGFLAAGAPPARL